MKFISLYTITNTNLYTVTLTAYIYQNLNFSNYRSFLKRVYFNTTLRSFLNDHVNYDVRTKMSNYLRMIIFLILFLITV